MSCSCHNGALINRDDYSITRCEVCCALGSDAEATLEILNNFSTQYFTTPGRNNEEWERNKQNYLREYHRLQRINWGHIPTTGRRNKRGVGYKVRPVKLKLAA
jgi:hypothetical protein